VPGADARDVTEPAHDLLGVNAVARLDGDVAQGPLTRGLDEVDRADIPAASPMADATRPSMPGRLAICRRIVKP